MDITDVAGLSQLAIRLGLLTESQVEEVREEMQHNHPAEFIGLCERKSYLTQWQSFKLGKGDTDGYFLGGYRMLYKIASGSFGRVFRADEPGSGRIVAIKVLRRRWSEDQQRIDLFFREGRVGMTLKHPNIVEILAVGQDPPTGQYYIVMEFVEGGNLREILKSRGKFSVAEALKITEEAAAGLAYAYSRGVTHRDMKLTNVLISSSGDAKLVDFGLAQFAAEDKEKDMSKDKVERTVDYAGLEKVTAVKPGDVRSDLYFLGCVLYELLAGKPPLEMSRDKNVRMQKQRFDNVPPLNRAEIQAPPSVFLLVETMMSLDASRRYQTPVQLLDAIKNARRDIEGRAAAGTPVQRTLFLVERNEHLQDKMREKFKELGYRVLLAGDPGRVFDRFRQQPFDALIVDARTVDEDGMFIFDQILTEAERKGVRCAGVIILGTDQTEWQERIRKRSNSAVLADQEGQQVTLKQLYRKLAELLEA